MGRFFSLPLAVLAIGCGSQEELGKVSGVVTIDGLPYPGGKVIFTPRPPAGATIAGRPALGRLDADGRYVLTTFDQGDGALVGEHTVSLFRGADDSQTRPDLSKLSFKRFNMRGGNVTVAAGENEFNFDITSDELRKFGSRL